MSKQVILTGLRANNDLTIGNYFGALLPIVDMAKTRSNDFQINLFVPDLHSFTTPIDHSKLQEQVLHNLRVFAAVGLPLDNDNVHIYRQSYIPAHSELTWILDCFTSMGQLNRMTQYKEKKLSLTIKQTDESLKRTGVELGGVQRTVLTGINYQSPTDDSPVSVGLYNYPVLMAADILLYNATYVPVGDDQTQHLEFTRDIAQRMNSKFNQELFVVPFEVKKQHEFFGKDQGLRIMDLSNPTKKMSKSDDSGKGVIFLGDTPDVAYKKITSATTDSVGRVTYDSVNNPGIANLIDLIALLDGTTSQEVFERYDGQTIYGPLKDELAEKMAQFLGEFQSRLESVNDTQLYDKLEKDEENMRKIANETLLRVQKAVGLRQ